MKKAISLFLSLVMLAGMVILPASAEEETPVTDETPVIAESEADDPVSEIDEILSQLDESQMYDADTGEILEENDVCQVTSNPNETIVYNYLTGTMGLNNAAACGVMANIQYESGFRHNVYGDNGTSYGICQWHASRFERLKSYAPDDWDTIDGQLRYLNYELNLNGYVYILNHLRGVENTADGAYDAGYFWCYYFEVPANRAEKAVTRGNVAKTTYWNEYGIADTEAPVISNIQVSDVSKDGYVVSCTVTDNVGLSKVQFPTWSEVNGQDDIIWGSPTITIVNTRSYSYRVVYGEHNNDEGYYITHIYAWDTSGNVSSVGGAYICNDKVDPVISDIKVTDVSRDGYTVSCTVTDNVGLSKVQFPTWSEVNGQDDIIWGNPTSVSGNTYSYRINISDHNNDEGYYITHIYAWDTSGNVDSASGAYIYNDREDPVISNIQITDITPYGYTVSCTATDNVGVTCVKFPTWTELYGGNDLGEWPYGTQSGNTYTYHVNISDHNNESGLYHTHVYAYDAAGNSISRAADDVVVPTVTYTIAYNANGGSGAPANQTKTYGVNLTLSSTEPTRTGYTFKNWNTRQDGTGTPYNAGATYSANEAVTLYAQWSETSTPTPTPAAGVEGFVTRLYSVCLGREPDTAGLNDWVSKLQKGSVSGTTAAYGFIFSDEFKNKNYCNEHFVCRLYSAFMGRDADEGGLNNWINHLETGMTREEVFNGFALSNEFNQICQSYGITQGQGIAVPQYGTVPHGACSTCGKLDGVTEFVTRMYTVCLNRQPDTSGLNDWCSKLWKHTQSGAGVAQGFIFSTELTNKNLSNKDFVKVLYKAFMGRDPDTAGWNSWTAQLDSGTTRQEVFNGFVGSAEFDNLCKKYGIVRG